MDFNYEGLVNFEGLLKPITSGKKKIKACRKAFWGKMMVLIILNLLFLLMYVHVTGFEKPVFHTHNKKI